MNVNEHVVRQDLDGYLVRISQGQAASYAKRLSLHTAWHAADLHDLEALGPIVQGVEQDFDQNVLTVRYNQLLVPLDETQLRQMLRVDGALAGWRLARLASDLCKSLGACHAMGLPQLILHPERVAIFKQEFVIMPSVAGVLPPLAAWLGNHSGPWLNYLAPEVLCTRALKPSLLPKGDIYALGRLLCLLVVPPEASPASDPFGQAEALVERPGRSIPPSWPAALANFRPLLERLCAFRPEDRPTLQEAAQEFHRLMHDLDIQTHVSSLIAERHLADVRALLVELQASQAHAVFAFPNAKIHQMSAWVALAESPPKYTLAFDQFEKALHFEPQNIFIHLEVARAYQHFTAHPQRLLFAESYYNKALRLAGWPADLIDEWVAVLTQLAPDKVLQQTKGMPWEKRSAKIFALRAAGFLGVGKADMALEETEGMPWEKRTAEIFALRATGFLALGEAERAWDECANYIETFGFDQRVFDTAEVVAESIEPLRLIRWMHLRPGADQLYALISIVWIRNGNLALAAQARALAPELQQDRPGGT